MKSSKNISPVKVLKMINSFSGFLALLSLIIMLIIIYMGEVCTLYYISGGIFMVFGLIFALTAVVFMVRSVVWHIKTKRMRYLFRHYLYALLIVYVCLMIIDHITIGKIEWDQNIFYSPLLAFGSIYLSGYLLAIKK